MPPHFIFIKPKRAVKSASVARIAAHAAPKRVVAAVAVQQKKNNFGISSFLRIYESQGFGIFPKPCDYIYLNFLSYKSAAISTTKTDPAL